MYVTLRCVRVTIFVEESNQYQILWVVVFGLIYTACKVHSGALYCQLGPIWLYHIFLPYLTYNAISGQKLMNRKCVLIFSKSLFGTTSTINQQMHLYSFHLKQFKTLKTTPTCFDLFRSSSGSFVVPC